MTIGLHITTALFQAIGDQALAWRTGALVFAVSLKAFFILLAAAAIAVCLRRAAAAARHLAWLLAIACLLALPLVTLWQSRLPVRALGPLTVRSRIPIVAYVQPPDTLAAPIHTPMSGTQNRTVTGQSSGSLAARPFSPAPSRVASVANGIQPEPRGEALARARKVATWLFFVWLGGALALLARLVVSLVLARRIAGRCEVIRHGGLRAIAEEAARLLGAPQIRLRLGQPSLAPAVPMTLGIAKPIVLLPAGAVDWPEDRLRAAMLHEIAHVRRRDWLWQVLAGVACALYWFDPLVWFAARRLRAESEMACDDHVLVSGALAADYAGHLLEIARSLSRAGSGVPTAIAAVTRSQIEGRLAAILDRARLRRPVSAQARALALALALLVLVPLGLLRFESQATARSRAPIARLTRAISRISPPALAGESTQLLTHGSLDLSDETLNSHTKGTSTMLSLKPSLGKAMATLAGLSLLASPTAVSAQSQSTPAAPPPPPAATPAPASSSLDAAPPASPAPAVTPAPPTSDVIITAPSISYTPANGDKPARVIMPNGAVVMVPAAPTAQGADTMPPSPYAAPPAAPFSTTPFNRDALPGAGPANQGPKALADRDYALGIGSNPFSAPEVTQQTGQDGQRLYTIKGVDSPAGLLTQLCQAAGVSYTVSADSPNLISVDIKAQPFDAALRSIVEASDPPMTYNVQNNVYHFRSKGDSGEDDSALPQQHVSLDLTNAPLDKALTTLFDSVHASYSIASGWPGSGPFHALVAKGAATTEIPVTISNVQSPVTVHLRDVPFPAALRAILNSTSPALTYTVKDGIIYIKPAGPEIATLQSAIGKTWAYPVQADQPYVYKPGDWNWKGIANKGSGQSTP